MITPFSRRSGGRLEDLFSYLALIIFSNILQYNQSQRHLDLLLVHFDNPLTDIEWL